MRECVRSVLTPRLGSEKAEELATIFRRGEWTYDHPLEVEALRRLRSRTAARGPPRPACSAHVATPFFLRAP